MLRCSQASPASSGSVLGSPADCICPKHLPGRHPWASWPDAQTTIGSTLSSSWMSDLLTLSLMDLEEETHFSCLHLWSHSFFSPSTTRDYRWELECRLITILSALPYQLRIRPPRLSPLTATQSACNGPQWLLLWVVGPLQYGPMSRFQAKPGRAPWAKAQPPVARQQSPSPGLGPECGTSNPPDTLIGWSALCLTLHLEPNLPWEFFQPKLPFVHLGWMAQWQVQKTFKHNITQKNNIHWSSNSLWNDGRKQIAYIFTAMQCWSWWDFTHVTV